MKIETLLKLVPQEFEEPTGEQLLFLCINAAIFGIALSVVGFLFVKFIL